MGEWDRAAKALELEKKRQEAEKERREEERTYIQHQDDIRDKFLGFGSF